MRRKTIYSVRTSLGRELWWTTGRKAGFEAASKINEGVVTTHGLKLHEVPVVVYRCSPTPLTVRELRTVVRSTITGRKP